MLNTCIRIATYILAATAVLAVTEARAVQRTHVSAAFGNDANTVTNCTAAAPCRFFAAAMTVTDTNGEVIVLDSGGYGAVTITKSLALIAPTGVYAGISVFPGANGVTIATPGINVVLRGLTINGQGGNNGINMTAGNKLSIENCVISNLTQNGINVSADATVRVTDTIVRDNGIFGIVFQNGVRGIVTRALVSGNGSSGITGGIFVQGTAANTTTTADIADSTIDGNHFGVDAFSTNATAVIRVSVRDSRAVRNTNYSVVADSFSGAPVSLAVSNSILSNNTFAIGAFNVGATVIASGNTITHNSSGALINSNAVIESTGNNTVRNNGTSFGTITAIATQ
jgi:hypothetical protein